MTAAAPHRPDAAPKLLGLEVLRFIAAFAVLLWHYQHFAFVDGHHVGYVPSAFALYPVLWPFFEAGDYGVWVFWCISGFIFFWKYRDAIHDRRVDGWRFFVLRFSRLYPLHIVTLLLVAVLQPFYVGMLGYPFVYHGNDVAHFGMQLLMATGWFGAQGDSFNGPIWSISVEVLIYVVFFMGLRFVSRSMLLNLVVLVLCLNLRGQIFSCLAFFYAGGLAAMLRLKLADLPARRTIELVAAVIAILVFGVGCQLGLMRGSRDWLFYLGFTPLLLFCLSSDLSFSARTEKLVLAVGNMTYASYLLHFPLQLAIAVGFAAAGRPIPYDRTWFLLAFVGGTLIASRLTFLLFEMPAQDWLRARMLRARRPVGPQTLVQAN